MRNISFSARAQAPDGVLFRDLNGESIILNLESETYFGLDEVGTRMWQVLTTQPTIEAALNDLCAEFDVDREQLRRDLEELLDQLVAQRLIEVIPPIA